MTLLTGVMILGLATIIGLMIWRFSAPSAPALPDRIALPDGVTARAVTMGEGWYAIVTSDDEILIFNAGDGALRQTVRIDAAR